MACTLEPGTRWPGDTAECFYNKADTEEEEEEDSSSAAEDGDEDGDEDAEDGGQELPPERAWQSREVETMLTRYLVRTPCNASFEHH